MKLLASLVSGAALSGIAAAVPQAQTSTSTSTSTPTPTPTPSGAAPQVTVYDEQNYQGESLSFAPDVTCQTLFPCVPPSPHPQGQQTDGNPMSSWIDSVRIPDNIEETIYCQLFDNVECTGEGGQVTTSSLPEVDAIYPAIICGVLA
ncbi:hypothetical protein BDV10DRAFT_184857 [Aspergillus recurvatus]